MDTTPFLKVITAKSLYKNIPEKFNYTEPLKNLDTNHIEQQINQLITNNIIPETNGEKLHLSLNIQKLKIQRVQLELMKNANWFVTPAVDFYFQIFMNCKWVLTDQKGKEIFSFHDEISSSHYYYLNLIVEKYNKAMDDAIQKSFSSFIIAFEKSNT